MDIQQSFYWYVYDIGNVEMLLHINLFRKLSQKNKSRSSTGGHRMITAEACGKIIAEARKEQNLTQKDVAERLHITDRAVSKWERGVSQTKRY